MQLELSEKEQQHLYRIRHSLAHVMAQAVQELYPETKFGIGPPIDTGFYYDFDLGKNDDGTLKTFTPEDLATIEKRMRQIIGGDHEFHYREVSAEEAQTFFEDQPYKLELIEGLAQGGVDEDGNETDEAAAISTYRQDSFEDLCKGPHMESTKKIPSDGFKLMSVAGAYWRGDENKPMMQRIYGTAWRNRKELKAHLRFLEEAKKRDHRKLGKELEIFTFDEEVGPGLPLWLPNGGIIIDQLETLAKEVEIAAGYDRVRTPHLSKEALFLRSGHLPYYADGMYPPMQMEGVTYYMKPMNCPFHHKIYDSKPRSYRDLPIRLGEYGTCYRYEKSGQLFGLMRVRSLQMNDAHLYLREDQFEQEFIGVIDLYMKYFKLFDIEKYVMRLSTHHKRGLGKKYVDNLELWLKTEQMVREVMEKNDVPYVEIPDEAAFYGPKIDVQIWSAIGREFTLATNQVDFAQPARFDLTYMDANGEEQTPLCIHRAPLSTHERFIGFLIEHYAGKFPVWLAPEQVRVIPITDDHHEYALKLEKQFREAGLRASADLNNERMNAKIRQAQMMQIPYMAIVGDQEIESETISLRRRDNKRQNGLATKEFVAQVRELIDSRSGKLWRN